MRVLIEKLKCVFFILFAKNYAIFTDGGPKRRKAYVRARENQINFLKAVIFIMDMAYNEAVEETNPDD